ncbi:hypothetical protein JI747_009140 [Chryseobacterium sp. RG1]|uniref:Copper chaperone CopZ n=1 Tax=Chryseobacterium tagetis TaxID=2801334 RepID=A0ABS8A1L6_9FLAO|nr:hypothetical protein [Chryseobacterium tagetis]MCA6067338.1 hypothetical protein [Chryseobacterium tagetis]
MNTKLIKLEDITGKHCIINTTCISSVIESHIGGEDCITVKMTDKSEIDLDMTVEEFYNLINE